MENMKARLEDVDLKNRLYLEREHAVFDKQLSDFHSDTASLKRRVQDVEAKNAKVTKLVRSDGHLLFSLCCRLNYLEPYVLHATSLSKLSEEWASFMRKPPPTWCPCVSTDSGQTHLSPQLQTALKRWFTEHFRVEDGVMKVIQHCLAV